MEGMFLESNTPGDVKSPWVWKYQHLQEYKLLYHIDVFPFGLLLNSHICSRSCSSCRAGGEPAAGWVHLSSCVFPLHKDQLFTNALHKSSLSIFLLVVPNRKFLSWKEIFQSSGLNSTGIFPMEKLACLFFRLSLLVHLSVFYDHLFGLERELLSGD